MQRILCRAEMGMLRTLILGLLVLIPAFQAASAQRFGRVEDTQTNVDAYYYFVQPGVATVQVYAFGSVQNPGVYVVAEGSRLGLVLALSGGPETSNQPDVKQTTTVRLFRAGGGARSVAYEASFEDVMDQADSSPTLQEGDIVTIEVTNSRRLNWRDFFTVIGPILSTLLLVERLTN